MEKRIKYLVALSIILLVSVPVCSAFTFRIGNIAVNIGEPDKVAPIEPADTTPYITPQEPPQDTFTEVDDRIYQLNTLENREYLESKMEEYNIDSILYTVSDQNIEKNYFYVEDRGFVVYRNQEPDVHIKSSPEQAGYMLDMVEDRKITLWERIRITSMMSNMETTGIPKLSLFRSW